MLLGKPNDISEPSQARIRAARITRRYIEAHAQATTVTDVDASAAGTVHNNLCYQTPLTLPSPAV